MFEGGWSDHLDQMCDRSRKQEQVLNFSFSNKRSLERPVSVGSREKWKLERRLDLGTAFFFCYGLSITEVPAYQWNCNWNW